MMASVGSRARVAGLLLALLAWSCGERLHNAEDPTPAAPPPQRRPEAARPANLLRNPGLERGKEPWFALFPQAPFEVTRRAAHGGEASALLAMRAGASEEGSRVYMLGQDLAISTLPETIGGHWRLEGWKRGAERQYLQLAVIVMGAGNLSPHYSNHQIRYILAGISDEPFEIRNARFVFLSREEPVEGEWVAFERDLDRDFLETWGAIPEDFEKIRVLFEARYDRKAPGSALAGDVFFDDLYLGPPRG